MIRGNITLLVCLLLALAGFQSQTFSQTRSKSKNKPARVLIQTELGDFTVEVDAVRAPVTVENFLKYVDAGHYDGGRFHRTVKLNPDNQPNNQIKIEVIQAGVNPEKEKQSFPPIRLERTNATGLKHRNGAISMARGGPDTATSDFFICIGDQPELDFGGKRNPDGQGFAAFGRVVKGMDAVKKIHQSPVEAQRLTPPIKIIGIKRIS
ncbi:MAG: peptidylprolyl isomerase [Blastocatellales bacterium]